MNAKRSYIGYVYIVLCALLFSTMEVVLKTVQGVFAPLQISCLRFLIGGIVLIPFALRGIRKKGETLRARDLPFFALTGFFCVAVSMTFYQLAVTYTKASVVAVIFSCNPIFVTVLAYLLLHEEIRRSHLLALALELLAVGIIIDPLHNSLDPTGALLAVIAAVFFAFYSVLGKKRTARFGGLAVTCLSFLFGSTEMLCVLLIGRTAAGSAFFRRLGLSIFADVPLLENIPASALPAFLYICVAVSAGGYVCHMMAMEKTSAREASLIFFLKPMLAPLIALVFLHEELTANMLLGIACFVLGSSITVIPGLLEARRG